MNRICPSEEVLSEYLAGGLSGEKRENIERHLSKCTSCRRLIAEAYHVTKGFDASEARHHLLLRLRRNIWILLGLISLLFSFLIPRYFLQLLALFIILGAKWIIDSRSTKTLIMISEAWKRGDKKQAEEMLSEFDPKK